ncbi:hypothetical protein SUGI_1036070 [Cryptomeria japonica]|nr:hypothetical protein SUGI_1036070 [Cryptomeria japonica]
MEYKGVIMHGKGGVKEERERGRGRIAPKGCVAVYVGGGEEEEQGLVRLIIGIHHLHHPFFRELLEAAEEAYGFHHTGPLKVPCNVENLKKLKQMIQKGK